MDLLQTLTLFQRVAETGSFTRAADALGMATSSVSAAVQKLEQHLGVPLFQRTTRSVRLSSEGEQLYERAARLLADAVETENLFRGDRAPGGQLRVEVPARMGRTLIAPALPGFLARYPQASIELGSTDRRANLVDEGIDCVLRVGAAGELDLVERPLGRLPQTTCASPALIAAHGMPGTLDALAQLPVVHFGRVAVGKTEDWEYLHEGRSRTLPMQGKVSVTSAETYIACCLAGIGLIQVPRYDVAGLLQSGELVEIVVPGCEPPSLPVAVLYPPQRRLSRLLHVFIDWLEELLAPFVAR